MKKALLIIAITMTALITLDTFAAVDPCIVYPELCPSRPKPKPTPRPCYGENKADLLGGSVGIFLQGALPPRSVSIQNLQVLLTAVAKEMPLTSAVKSIVALKPHSYNGLYTVIDSKDCKYNYHIVLIHNEFGEADIHQAVLQNKFCSDLSFNENISIIAKPLGGVCCSGFSNPGRGCDPGC